MITGQDGSDAVGQFEANVRRQIEQWMAGNHVAYVG